MQHSCSFIAIYQLCFAFIIKYYQTGFAWLVNQLGFLAQKHIQIQMHGQNTFVCLGLPLKSHLYGTKRMVR